MKTIAIAVIVGLAALGAVAGVVEAGPPGDGFGTCHLEDETVGYVTLPDGSEQPVTKPTLVCYW